MTSGVSLVAMLGQGRRSNVLGKALYQYGKARIRETIRRLHLQNYIRYDSSDITLPIELTEDGLRHALHNHLLALHRSTKKRKWDYLWRVVMFDIPETHRAMRNGFRKKLDYIGFFPLQKSIFVTPYPCEDEMEELCRSCRLRKYVLIFIAASLGRKESEARRFFFGEQYKE